MISKAFVQSGFQGIHLNKSVQCFHGREGCNYAGTLAKRTVNWPENTWPWKTKSSNTETETKISVTFEKSVLWVSSVVVLKLFGMQWQRELQILSDLMEFQGKFYSFYSSTVNSSLFLLNISTKYLAKTKLSIYEGSFRIILSVILQM